MKKAKLLILIVLVFSFAISIVNATTFDTINKKKGIKLFVVIPSEQTQIGQKLMNSVEKYWTSSAYEFIGMDELNEKGKISQYFLVPIESNKVDELYGFKIIKGGRTPGSTQPNLKTVYDKDSQRSFIVYNYDGLTLTLKLLSPCFSSNFLIAVINSVFELDIVLTRKEKKSAWINKTGDGIIFYKTTTKEQFKGKTLLVDVETAKKLGGFFQNGNTLKSYLSKVLEISQDSIHELNLDELMSTFDTNDDNILYMYNYYRQSQFSSFGKNNYWMYPYIFDFKGRFLAVLHDYKNLKKSNK